MALKKNYKLNIFDVLKNISCKNKDFFSSLTKEKQKALQPFVLMRWLSGTSDPRQVFFLNELVNPFVFQFTDHKELLVNLLMVCSPGKSKRYYWNKALGKQNSSTPQVLSVIKEFFHYTSSHALDALKILSNDEIIFYAEQLGRQPKEIKEIKKELKARVQTSI